VTDFTATERLSEPYIAGILEKEALLSIRGREQDSHIPSDRYEFRIRNKEHRKRYCV
jgi:hypothetical protein